MGREKDKFWEYVEDLNDRFLCKFCGCTFSGGIARIKSHLAQVSGREIKICPKVPEDVRVAAHQAISVPKKKASSLRCVEAEIIASSALNKKDKKVRQPDFLGACSKDKSEVDKMLAKFIFSNETTLDVSEIPLFVELMKSIAEFGPSYELPNYSALASTLLPDVLDEVEEYIGNVKKFFATTGCTIMMSNVVKNSKLLCINLFAYTPGGVVYIEKISVPEEGMTFLHFIHGIYNAIESLGPMNVVQCLFNNSDDHIVHSITDFVDDDFFLSVQGMILRKYPWIYMTRCASCEFGVLLILLYMSVPWVHKTTQLAKLIFKNLYKHDINLLQRWESARNKEYNRNSLTKIAMEFFMLNSILEVEKDIQALQLPIASASCEQEGPSSNNDVTEVLDKAINSTEFWRRGKNVAQVLQPLFQVLDFIDANGSTSGYFYEAMNRAEDAIKQNHDGNDQVHYEMIHKVYEKWRNRIIHPIYAAAAFLNPAYILRENFSEDTEIQEVLELLTFLVPSEEQEALFKQVQLYRVKASDLFTDTAMTMINKIHPRKWWECYGDNFPILQKHAMRILSQTCATSKFDSCSFQVDDLADQLRMNTILMEKSSLLRSQNSEPINLDRNSGLPKYSHKYVKKYLEDVDRSDNISDHDLLVIHNPNDQIFSPSKSNYRTGLIDIIDENEWTFILSQINNLDDC